MHSVSPFLRKDKKKIVNLGRKGKKLVILLYVFTYKKDVLI